MEFTQVCVKVIGTPNGTYFRAPRAIIMAAGVSDAEQESSGRREGRLLTGPGPREAVNGGDGWPFRCN